MANDGVCDGSDLQHLLFDANKVEAQLLAALDVLSLHPATPRRSTLRADANGPITRSCASRQREVVRIISLAHGLASVVRVFADMGVIDQKYAYESATTAGPLVQVERTLTTAAPRPGPRRSLSPGPGYPPTAPPSRGCGAPSGPPPARPPPRMTSLRPGQRGGARPRAPPTRRASRRQAAASPFRLSFSRSTDPALGRACVPYQPCMRSPSCPCAWCAGHPLRPWPGRAGGLPKLTGCRQRLGARHRRPQPPRSLRHADPGRVQAARLLTAMPPATPPEVPPLAALQPVVGQRLGGGARAGGGLGAHSRPRSANGSPDRAGPTTSSRPPRATCRASTHPAGTRARRSRASCASFNARISGARGRSGSRASRARLPLGGISKGTLQSGTQRIGTVTGSPPRRGRTGDYLPSLGLSEVARLQACDLWFDHSNGYAPGTHGFDGSCAAQTWRGPGRVAMDSEGSMSRSMVSDAIRGQLAAWAAQARTSQGHLLARVGVP